jgi:hypothetical protein
MGTLYGILFEPWFRRKITQQGLRAKARPLEMEGVQTRKRKVFGIGSDEEAIVKWPAQNVHRFFDYPEIIVDKYNIPQVANLPVDSLAPSRGELFQITVAESHEIKAAKLHLLKPYFNKFLTATGQRVKLYFILPPHRYKIFKSQRYLYPRSSVPCETYGLEPTFRLSMEAGPSPAPPSVKAKGSPAKKFGKKLVQA